ncbi:MAG TPA: ABC transporter ATP-binding protein [Kofleriaceae bacterium]|nr:ABC transporter ATP-binding protein [Kofleriaceae bacterium]
MDDVVLELRGLGKDYGERRAVDAIDLDVRRGEIFGMLGPNGAGKTSTISMACGVMPPSRGHARIDGHDIVRDRFAAKRAIGLVPQDLALYDELTPRQNLTYFAELYGLAGAELTARVAWALGVAGLTDRADDRVKTFSGGMKRRLNLTAGMIHKPTLLVCDEPTVGVDPQSRRHIFEAIKQLRADGMTILYTSHYMEEVEELCDRVAIMDGGKVVACGTLDELTRAHGTDRVALELSGDPAVLEAAMAAIAQSGATVERRGAAGNLEAVFLALTGRGLRDE